MIPFTTLLLTAMVSWAGNKVGNGGDVVVCPESKSVLDLYEAKSNGAELREFSENLSHSQIIKDRLEKLKEKAPVLGSQYLRRLETMQTEIDFKSDVELADVKDSAHAFIGKDCKLFQIAIRKGYVPEESQKRFLIRQDLWEQIDETNKAALLTHEIIYEHLSKLGVSDSRPARQMVSKIFSKNFDKESKGSFWEFIASLKVPIYP